MAVEWWVEEPASDADEVRRRHEANKASWEQAAAIYGAELDGSLAALRAGESNLHPVERDLLLTHRGPLDEWCEVAIHLQCASGRDTLSLWLEGAQNVVGIDIAERHIENARELTEALDAPATWHRCDVLDTPHVLDATADLVYTGRGAIGWVHDLDAWAAVVARLLRPGGILCLLDDHPSSYLFDPDADHLTYSGMRYFDSGAAGRGFAESYIDHLGVAEDEVAVNHDRLWTFADLFAATRAAGLEWIHLGEHPESYWDPFPALPEEVRRGIPNTFSLLARRPS